MPGQYKIRSNSKDDFSDIKKGYKIAKSGAGGCWQGIKSCLGLILLLAICGFVMSVVSGTASAQDDNACFPYKFLYTTGRVDIRSDSSRFSSSRTRTVRSKTYAVLESKSDSLFNSCWIRINDGWILRRATGSVIKPGKKGVVSNKRATTTTTSDQAQTSAQNGDTCFPHKSLYTTGEIDIRNDISRSSSSSEKTVSNQTYAVLESKTDSFGSCWIKINGGWILRRATGSSVKPGEAGVTTTATTGSSKCYAASRAYITGNMNIRRGPSTNHTKVGLALSGESFTVSQSKRDEDYCWLKISKGWMADTGRVQANKPAVVQAQPSAKTSTTSSISSTNLDGLPPIDGDATFQSGIVKAFNYMRNRAPNWFNYVTAKVRSVGSHGAPGGKAHVHQKRITINPSYYPNTMELASVLVHEACHIYQFDRGNWQGVSVLTLEEECTQVQIDMVGQVAPGSGWLSRLRRWLTEDIPRIYAGR